MMARIRPLAERFWEKVDKRRLDECWPWTACVDGCGYGLIGSNAEDNWRLLKAHRVAWTFTYGSIPEGLCVCHHCDNKICCNPLHLFLGTQADNTADKVSKNRQARGEGVAQSKITAEDAGEIRQLYAAGRDTIRSIARRYPIGRSQVHRIINHDKWKHV